MKQYVNSDGDCERWEYDESGNEIYFEDSNGYWMEKKYDKKGNVIYGKILIDTNERRNMITIDRKLYLI